MARTTRLFKAPGFYPNGLAATREGLWVQQQHLTRMLADGAGAPWPAEGKEALWLMDWDGRLLATFHSDCANGSGVAVGDGRLWVMANTSGEGTGVYVLDRTTGRQIDRRQIPLSPNDVSGGIHGTQWRDGKLWICNNRIRALMRIDPASWTPELLLPIPAPNNMTRYHDFTFDTDGTILQAVANESTGPDDSKAALVRYDAATGQAIETITLVEGSCDPHGLDMHDGRLISCDAGYHPGWKDRASDSSGWIFSIDLI
jgi:hypothetical protein